MIAPCDMTHQHKKNGDELSLKQLISPSLTSAATDLAIKQRWMSVAPASGFSGCQIAVPDSS